METFPFFLKEPVVFGRWDMPAHLLLLLGVLILQTCLPVFFTGLELLLGNKFKIFHPRIQEQVLALRHIKTDSAFRSLSKNAAIKYIPIANNGSLTEGVDFIFLCIESGYNDSVLFASLADFYWNIANAP